MASFFTTAFYHFTALTDIKSTQTIIQDYCDKVSIKGTILLANEGINGTISGDEKNILKVIKPLFLDELNLEFDKVKSNSRKLNEFHLKIEF